MLLFQIVLESHFAAVLFVSLPSYAVPKASWTAFTRRSGIENPRHVTEISDFPFSRAWSKETTLQNHAVKDAAERKYRENTSNSSANEHPPFFPGSCFISTVSNPLSFISPLSSSFRLKSHRVARCRVFFKRPFLFRAKFNLPFAFSPSSIGKRGNSSAGLRSRWHPANSHNSKLTGQQEFHSTVESS